MLLLVHSATRTVNKFRITIDSGHIWLTLSSWRYLRQNLNCLWQNEIKCFNYFTVAYQSISRRNWINKTVGNKVFYEVYEKVNICKSNNIYIIKKQSDGDKNIPCWTPNLRNKKILFRQWVMNVSEIATELLKNLFSISYHCWTTYPGSDKIRLLEHLLNTGFKMVP